MLSMHFSGSDYPRKILVVCDKWSGWHHSLYIVNRHLCKSLARQPGIQVACLVLDARETDERKATRDGIFLIKAANRPGVAPGDRNLLFMHDSFPFDAPEIVIGHGSATGAEAAEISRRFKCKFMHILYDPPEEFADDEINPESVGKLEKQAELGRNADFVAAIGPSLALEWINNLNRNDVMELIPGIPEGIQRNSIPSPSNRCLIIDSMTKGRESGLHLSRKALNDCKKRVRPIKVTVQGTNRLLKDELKKQFECEVSRSNCDVHVTSSEASLESVRGEISAASLLMIPEATEMFGVRALDAIGAGVPILINSNLGLARVLLEYFDKKFWEFLCSSDDEDAYETWSERIDSFFDDRDKYFSLAAELKREWQSIFSWDALANKMLQEFSKSGYFTSSSLQAALAFPCSSACPSHCSAQALKFVKEELHLNEKRRKHILAVSPIMCQEVPPIYHFSKIPWISVFDLDVNSPKTGILSGCEMAGNEMGLKICRIICPEDPEERKRKVNIPKGVPWILLEGTQESKRSMNDCLEWLRNVFGALDSNHHVPITMLVLWNPCEQSRSLSKKIAKLLVLVESSSLKVKVKLAIVSTGNEPPLCFQDIEEDWNVTVHSLSLVDLCNAINDVVAENPLFHEHMRFALPVASSDGAIEMKTLPHELRWINAELEVLYQSVGDTPDHETDDANHFYRGGTISWYALNSDYAIERETWEPIRTKIDELLPTAGTICLQLPHKRGTGGTTTARKILFDYHHSYPCVNVKSINLSETAPAIKALADFCKLPVIALVDCKHIQGEEFDLRMLFNNLSNSRAPCIILQIVHQHVKQGKGLALKAAECLSDNEAEEFVKTYSNLNKGKLSFLQKLRRNDRKELQIPFYYALVTFEDQFTALDPFVEDCIMSSDGYQRKVLTFLAIAHHYGHATIPEATLTSYLNVPFDTSLEDVLTKESLQLLIEEEEGEWRPRHDLIGSKMLEKLLTLENSSSQARRVHPDYWIQSIAEKAKEFICHMPEKLVSHLLTARVLTDEKHSEYFSPLINDIPDDDDAISVFEKAIDVFPDNIFFKVHLGRFYSLKKKAAGFEMAVKYTDEGIDGADSDMSRVVRGQFAQMRGIVCSRQVNYLMTDGVELETMINHASEGCKWFRRAVSICPDMVDGYIPEVRMMCRLFEHIHKTTGSLHRYLQDPECHQFILDGISKTLDTLECVPDSDNYTYWKVRILNLGLRKERHPPPEETLDVLENLRISQKASRGLINRHIAALKIEICRSEKKSLASIAHEVIELLNEALACDKDGLDRTMSMWVQIAPFDPTITIQDGESRIVKWCTETKSLRSYLYKYIMVFLRALDKDDRKSQNILKDSHQDLINTIRAISRKDVGIVQDPEKAVVWLGKKTNNMDQLIYLSFPDIGALHRRTKKVVPVEQAAHLRRLTGIIARTDPKLGQLSVGKTINFKFRTDLCDPPLTSATFANRKVEFFLAFNYFGVEAFNVKVIDDD